MDQLLLALLSFGLGIGTTILTQIVTRRFQFTDAKQKRRLEKLKQIRAWMEAYRALFQCEYPNVNELVYANEYLSTNSPLYNDLNPKRVYSVLKKYREAKSIFEQAERQGYEALGRLGDDSFPRRIIFRFEMAFSRSLYTTTPHGFPKTIAPYLSELSKRNYDVFEQFPKWQARQSIDWDKLDYIAPTEINTIIHSRLLRWTDDHYSQELKMENSARASEVADARDNLPRYKSDAEVTIDNILHKVQEYEDRWLVPVQNG